MAIGPFIRKNLGPFEKPISDAYRNFFMSMRDLAETIHKNVPEPKNILEVGCGEGAIMEFFSELYPQSKIVGIDIIDHVGRQFNKNRTNIEFQKIRIEDYVINNEGSADLIYVGDVLHHIPKNQHVFFLNNVKKALKPNGIICIKDIDRNAGIIAFLVYFTDRFVTGDKVNYLNVNEFIALFKTTFGEDVKYDFGYIKPWKSNIIFFIQN